MSIPDLDERAQAAALSAAITAQLGPWQVFEYGKVPGLDGNAGEVPSIYVLLQVTRRFLPARSAVRRASRAGWRASIRGVGRTADECRWVMNRISAALDSQRLTVGDHRTSVLQHETSDDPESDNGRYSALVRFTYAT